MPGLLAGAQTVASWTTGEIVVYVGAILLAFTAFGAVFGRGLYGFFTAVMVVILVASSPGIARTIYEWFHSA
ncbi:MAG: hypothetical protein NVSMB20_17380 [Bradyrhizobium sp.]